MSGDSLAQSLLTVNRMWKEDWISDSERDSLKDWLLSRDGDAVAQAQQAIYELMNPEEEPEPVPRQVPEYTAGYPSLVSPSRNAQGNVNELRSGQLTEIIDAIEDAYHGWHCGLARVEKIAGEAPVFAIYCNLTNAQTPKNQPPQTRPAVFLYDFESGELEEQEEEIYEVED